VFLLVEHSMTRKIFRRPMVQWTVLIREKKKNTHVDTLWFGGTNRCQDEVACSQNRSVVTMIRQSVIIMCKFFKQSSITLVTCVKHDFLEK
jgi:hypothetical protein